ncbi:LysR family transcriptional regulator [Agrobacterium genomosp. 3]|jgi:DNA-binding transcriptional LysR family regulator|uniref:LysR family transcriptional regulator n=1 Tax=Agrobacterium TaxID=357 RepID=UPI001CD8ABD0|nr:LysR family transcriptional regulator [Agrobacterium pusense]MCA1867946.1 LysR family transcriptional regulator [Agrobacterium tomkonis]MCA1878361.1 LysR family transcriptional regulator [Agrobacterium tumefaciens]MCA1893521.1 LysR family transcriptional regulator [Agrobacterium tomkonis]MDH0117053.1 LysR family transcriptional regulator [Agrobacterium pusense]MDH0872579.1 LysR family transcriptional regulator [Agrobacterium pusense]
MEVRQLRYFVEVVRQKNFSRAAGILNIAQPPLSRQIQQLEEELGVTLIDRTTRPLNLTEAGRFFYQNAVQILSRLDHIRDQTRKIGGSKRERFIIGCVASTLYSGTPDLVRRMRKKWPDLDIDIKEMMSTEQIAALKENRIDLGFGRVRFNDPEVERLTLREERLVVAIPMEHPKTSSSDPMPLSELEGEPFIVYPSALRPSFADEILNLLAEFSITPSSIEEVREIQAALGMVAAGAGLCIVPASSQRQRPDDVFYRMIEEKQATSPVIMSYRRADADGRIKEVKQLIQEMYADKPTWLQLSELWIERS